MCFWVGELLNAEAKLGYKKIIEPVIKLFIEFTAKLDAAEENKSLKWKEETQLESVSTLAGELIQ